ncbi:hypothetical protein CIP107528_02270 [Corynebacterium diphtheriae]|nr:hypothetical protein CIP107525_02219 [Corynebacterium diphtheriae]CAB0574744.1 hypothetical protein CIP107528_02270 [Corynebacterium diphtheriae]
MGFIVRLDPLYSDNQQVAPIKATGKSNSATLKSHCYTQEYELDSGQFD